MTILDTQHIACPVNRKPKEFIQQNLRCNPVSFIIVEQMPDYMLISD